MNSTDMLHLWIELLTDVYEQQTGEWFSLPSEKDSFAKLVDVFEQILFLCSQKQRIILLIDAVNQFGENARSINFDYLPVVLPTNVAVVVSCLPGRWLDQLRARGSREVYINGLSPNEVRRITSNLFEREGKTHISSTVINALIEMPLSHNPLLLSAYIQQLLIIDEDDFNEAGKLFEGLPDDVINEQLLLHTIENCTSVPELVFPELIKKACKRVDPQMASLCLGLIAYSAFGLRDIDIERAFQLMGIPFIFADFLFVIKRFKLQFRQDINKAWNLQHSFVIDSMKKVFAKESESLKTVLSNIFSNPNMENQFELFSAFTYHIKARRTDMLEKLIFSSVDLDNKFLMELAQLAQELAVAEDTQADLLRLIIDLYDRHPLDEEFRLLPFLSAFLQDIDSLLPTYVLKEFLRQLDSIYRIDKFLKTMDMRVAHYLSSRAELEMLFGNLTMAKNLAQYCVNVGEKVFGNDYFPIIYRRPFEFQFGCIYGKIRCQDSNIREKFDSIIGKEKSVKLFSMNKKQVLQMQKLLLEIDILMLKYSKILSVFNRNRGKSEDTISELNTYEFFMETQSANSGGEEYLYMHIMRCRLGLLCFICEAAFADDVITKEQYDIVRSIYKKVSRWDKFHEWLKSVNDGLVFSLLGKIYSMGAVAWRHAESPLTALQAFKESSEFYEKSYRVSSGLEQLILLIESQLAWGKALFDYRWVAELQECQHKTLPYLQLLQRHYPTYYKNDALIKLSNQIFNLNIKE